MLRNKYHACYVEVMKETKEKNMFEEIDYDELIDADFWREEKSMLENVSDLYENGATLEEISDFLDIPVEDAEEYVQQVIDRKN